MGDKNFPIQVKDITIDSSVYEDLCLKLKELDKYKRLFSLMVGRGIEFEKLDSLDSFSDIEVIVIDGFVSSASASYMGGVNNKVKIILKDG